MRRRLAKTSCISCVCVKRVLKRSASRLSLSVALPERFVSHSVAAPLAPRTSCFIIVQWQKTVGVFRHPDVYARGLLARGLGRQRRNQVYTRFLMEAVLLCTKNLFGTRPCIMRKYYGQFSFMSWENFYPDTFSIPNIKRNCVKIM